MDTANSQTLAVQAVEKEVTPVLNEAQAIADAIHDDATYAAAGEYLIRNAAAKKRVTEILDPFRVAAYEAYQKTLAEIKRWTEPLDQKRAIVEPKWLEFHQEQEQRRSAEQAKLQAAEQKRQEDIRLSQAEVAEASGDKRTAEDLLNQPIVVAPVILPAMPKVNGSSVKTTWHHEVVNLQQLVKAVAEGRVPLQALQPNDVFLGQQARSQKNSLNYPGVKIFSRLGGAFGKGRAA